MRGRDRISQFLLSVRKRKIYIFGEGGFVCSSF
ncbi:hypothetical protein LINPERHAP1_LOCUS14052 [Linum perenne]